MSLILLNFLHDELTPDELKTISQAVALHNCVLTKSIKNIEEIFEILNQEEDIFSRLDNVVER